LLYAFSVIAMGGAAVSQSSDDAPGKIKSVDRGAPSSWRKSTWSIANGQCIETAALDGRLAVRDSVDKSGPSPTFTVGEWRTFIKSIKNGDFDTI
jgi:hypothetical protein